MNILTITQWEMEKIFSHTYPQLLVIHRNKNKIIYPYVKPWVEYSFGKSFMDNKSLDNYLTKMESRLYDMHQGNKIEQTGDERKRSRAMQFYAMEWLGLPPLLGNQTTQQVVPLDLTKMGAAAIVEWLKEEDGNACDNDSWIDDVSPLYNSIRSIAEKE